MDASWKCPGNKEKWKSPVVEPFPLELTCNERYSKNRRKLQFSLLRSSWFFLPSIKIAQLVSDIKQHHMTNTYHNDYDCWRFFVQSINNGSFIHSRASARESVCLYTRHAVTNSWKRRTGGKLCAAKQSLSICYTTYTALCELQCFLSYGLQSRPNDTNTALVFFLSEWNIFGILLWNR